MSQQENLKIIAFVGLAGAGKSSAVEYLTDKGYPKVYFGGIILEAVKDAGLDVNPENEKLISGQLREREGRDVIVKRIIAQIHDLTALGQHHVVADGISSWTEYKAMKAEFPGELVVVAIVAPKHLRHHRLNVRPIRPMTDNEANQQDWFEIENIEKGGPIAIADYTIINDGELDNLYTEVDKILEHADFK